MGTEKDIEFLTNFTINPILQFAGTNVANNMRFPQFIVFSVSTPKITVICRFSQWRDRLFLTRTVGVKKYVAKVASTVHTNSGHIKPRNGDYQATNKQ